MILKLTLPLWETDCDDVARKHMVMTEASAGCASMGISKMRS